MIAEKLKKVVTSQPSSIAIDIIGDRKVSYEELWIMINSACKSIDTLFGDDKYIALVADQNARAVIISIATILSGKILIPLDPRLEPSAIEDILKPFTTKLISEERRQYSSDYQVILIDDITISEKHRYVFETANTHAYILHTSGTTGKPKSVLADSHALLHVCKALAKRYHFDARSKVLQFAYLSFDSSLVEIWSTLFAGGTIVIAGKKLREDLYGCLETLMVNKHINAITLPPSVARVISENIIINLKTLVIAGEEMPLQLANQIFHKVRHLINAYGPTESIICASTYEVRERHTEHVPIGRPLPKTQIVIEKPDSLGRGEMIIVSDYLAVGYVNDRNLSEKKFGKNKAQQRYYRTGDIGGVTRDGEFVFFGRLDNQIKINGQRVELEGVEANIRSVLKNDAVVVVNVANKLYCFYKSNENVSLDYNALISKLSSKMPSYSIPSNFEAMSEFPLDRNGKIDRKRLALKISDSQGSDVQNLQTDSAHDNYISIWVEVLEIPASSFNWDTSFFGFGGDSLKALKLIKEINNQYACNLRLSDILADPATPKSIFGLIEKTGAKI